jgi:predicted nucleic acid-binding protein
VSRFVLDASVAVAWVAGMPMDPYAASVQAYAQRGGRAIVPFLWLTEVSNGVLMLERRKVLARSDADTGLCDLQRFFDTSAEVDHVTLSFRQMVDLARTWQLTVYDALYLELARRENAPLATLDKSMRAAVEKAGLALLK